MWSFTMCRSSREFQELGVALGRAHSPAEADEHTFYHIARSKIDTWARR
jgi:hypothetical protein